MRLAELQQLLVELRDVGFVPTERSGPTGVGHTLESWLGVSENNLPIPDIGGRVEIKATRAGATNLITLFTFNRAVWTEPMADTISRWGYEDDDGRPSLYSTVTATGLNPQGLQIHVADDGQSLWIQHAQSGDTLATWDMYEIVGKFMSKFERLLFVLADTRQGDDGEEFHFTSASLLSEPKSAQFRESFLAGHCMIDIRAHVQPNGTARNHGTGFRVNEQDLPHLFSQSRTMI